MANKAAAQQRRQSEAGRMARQSYNRQPEVKARKAVKRALKHHQTPGPIKTQ